MTSVNAGVLIGLDWGTTSLRAHLLDSDGQVLDRRSSAEGILADQKGGFAETFQRVTGGWFDVLPSVPVVASGMITSRNGWVETPYVSVPAGIDELASSLVPFDVSPSCTIHFVCGMDQDPPGGTPDIMRGEETQIVGCLSPGCSSLAKGAAGLFVMPGTHSKWISVCEGNLDRFDTYMTGEVFAVLKEHSILGRLMETGGGPMTGGFERGVSARLDSEASLLRHIFSSRTLALFDRLEPGEIADYLSGLLIGEEVRSAMRDFDGKDDGDSSVTIVGSGALTDRYRVALALAGITAAPAPEDAAARGHFSIARQAGLIDG
ncbi:2-dehydro-3-deoxygalactonokinase [Hwanghaeella grinnelliae]|uniref:2-dehydro-3-deoxygalactonokinase n=1 Tax=Hwanghaeella grinnelliae TaxID=2500179 RepID=A0A3S2WTN4_9PROT|nr:2-dehydro-3-deoxygalactonokinase [Hwanghaeella grinnelliae]RVU38227.1 2-dehydro-3-deoxygalactonokinase [Hwanghaeella grinnelliae]